MVVSHGFRRCLVVPTLSSEIAGLPDYSLPKQRAGGTARALSTLCTSPQLAGPALVKSARSTIYYFRSAQEASYAAIDS